MVQVRILHGNARYIVQEIFPSHTHKPKIKKKNCYFYGPDTWLLVALYGSDMWLLVVLYGSDTWLIVALFGSDTWLIFYLFGSDTWLFLLIWV